MALAQEDMIAGPDAVIVWLLRIMVVIMIMTPVMVMIVIMTMRMIMAVKGMVVRHGRSLARYRCKISYRLGENAQKRQQGSGGNECAKQQKPGISREAQHHAPHIVRYRAVATLQTGRICVFTSAAERGR